MVLRKDSTTVTVCGIIPRKSLNLLFAQQVERLLKTISRKIVLSLDTPDVLLDVH